MSKSDTIFMETTKIAPKRTISDIQDALIAYNVNAVMIEVEDGEPVGFAFRVRIDGSDVPFRVPCRWKNLADTLRRRARISDGNWSSTYDWNVRKRKEIEAKALRVAWRQILRWIEAQLALVETGMVTIDEVFFPYVQIGKSTAFQIARDRGLPAMLEFKA